MKNHFSLVLALGSAPAQAVDAFSVEAGKGDGSTELVRVNAKWDWDKKWFEEGNWSLTGY